MYTASGDQALLLSRKCQFLQEEKTKKKNVENNGEKAYLYFYRQNFAVILFGKLSHPYPQGQKNRQEIGFLVVVRIYI